MYAQPDEPSGTGHMMIAIDPAIVMSAEDFARRMNDFYRTIKASPTWDGSEMFLPGEIEARTEARRRKEGIPLPSDLFDELAGLAAEHGVAALVRT